MADKGIVPVKFALTNGDYYTLWAPEWREHGAEWQAFLGSGDELYVFDSPAALLAFLNSGEKHDLTEHPKWALFTARPANRVVPSEREDYDFIGLPAALAGRPSHANVTTVAKGFHMAQNIGEVMSDEVIASFFNSHAILGNVERGMDHFTGDNGQTEWTTIGRIVLDKWNSVVDALDADVTVKELPEEAVAASELAITDADNAASVLAEAERKAKEEAAAKVDPYDESTWSQAGIDPVKITLDGSTLYTLRTYLEGQPVFLGKYGEIYTFPSSRALVRWLLEHSDHDLARTSTWDEIIMPAAQAGELEVMVHPDNTYDYTGLVKAINEGPDSVDTDQMSRAYELFADAADWAGDDSLNSFFLENPKMQDYISYMLGSTRVAGYIPTPPYKEHADSWRKLEEMLSKRFSKS